MELMNLCDIFSIAYPGPALSYRDLVSVKTFTSTVSIFGTRFHPVPGLSRMSPVTREAVGQEKTQPMIMDLLSEIQAARASTIRVRPRMGTSHDHKHPSTMPTESIVPGQ